MSSLPGVRVGPLDPDRTSDFGQVAGRSSARQLIRLHAQSHPRALQNALIRKLDDERTKALDMDEVRDYLAELRLENGDPAVPEGAEVVGASVRGERDQVQQLTYTYRVAGSGRTAKWFADYNGDVLPDSFAAGDERVRLAELKERGVVVTDAGATATAPSSADRAEQRELRRRLAEAEELLADTRAELEARDERDAAAAAAADQEPAPLDDDDDDADDEEPDEQGGGAQEVSSAQEPPIEGYDDMNGASIAKLVKDKDTSDETIQAILDYERGHDNRRGVVGAAEQTLGARGSAE